jgi:formylglycine-generating enzyme required for sulfatase activity
MTASDPTLQPGARVERFEIVQILGSGGTAHVYRVRHTMLGSDHALKLLTPAHASLRDRLAQEGRVQAKLRHPNIVAVTDVVEHEGRAGLVMELVRGPTLDHWLRERGPLPPLDAIRLMDGVLAAVAAAHAAEVLHRDLKPANVLLEEGPHGLVARVTDFGIAKVFSEDARGDHTRIGVTMGTPGYMAPEQWADAANADATSDVFALGVILYELMAGARPYDGASSTAVLDATVSGRHVHLVDRLPAIDPEVAAVIERAIRPDPSDRYPSVSAFRDALRDAAGIATRAEPTIVFPPPHTGESPTPTIVATGGPRTHMPFVVVLAAPLVFGSLALGAMAWWVSRAEVTITDPSVETPARPLVSWREPTGPMLVTGGPFFFGDATRPVEVGSFRIDRTEVATADYLACVQAYACTPPEWTQSGPHDEYDGLLGDRQPVVGVTWTQASTYCAWRDGRLPTEIEWERAATWSPYATDVSDKRAWPWGAAAPSCDLANYQACRTGTREVTELAKGASAYGVLNMVGNVWEWTASEHALSRKKGLGGVFQKKAPRSHRVLKGGGYNASAADISPTDRFHASEDAASPLYGFRCAYDAP